MLRLQSTFRNSYLLGMITSKTRMAPDVLLASALQLETTAPAGMTEHSSAQNAQRGKAMDQQQLMPSNSVAIEASATAHTRAELCEADVAAAAAAADFPTLVAYLSNKNVDIQKWAAAALCNLAGDSVENQTAIAAVSDAVSKLVRARLARKNRQQQHYGTWQPITASTKQQ
jgi:hypothetical protein